MIDLNNIELYASELLDKFKNSPKKKYELKGNLASYIDHTILKPEANEDEVKKVCSEAKEFNFKSVCVNPSYVDLCKQELKASEVKVCIVIGFPLGANTSETKIAEAEQAIANGATELDMVINVGRLKNKDFHYVLNDISEIAKLTKNTNALSKVIIETCLLTDVEKVIACLLAKEAGADFVKTSTGFSKAGATADDIALMRFVVGEEMGVKASGGVRTYEDTMRMIENGASRIGASASIQIVKGEKPVSTGY
ncbi:MAG: deoxyribose-phosphate aldolase [Ignavibacteriales bacterium]|nr:MAG: deoxyribose-phosphate aldolase [Ignavibacteriales bacterium]